MANRTVSVSLKADISQMQAAMVKAAASVKTLGDVVDAEATDIENAGKRAGVGLNAGITNGVVVASRNLSGEGEKAGGKLAQGINAGLIRNSPLIAAGIAAGLVAGTPAILGAAGAMFAGIGALALKSNAEVAGAWSSLGDTIKAEAASDAAVLVPTYVGMAEEIGRAFEELRPQMRSAFADSSPLVDSFTDGVTGLARNAMPGLVTAVGAAGPAFEGLQSMLEDVGTGLGSMFEVMSRNGDSAGVVMESLGEILGDALPILGELVGSGSVLASQILPPVADAMGMVADVAEDLGPLLPAIVAGFTGMKIAGAVSGGLSSMSGGLATLAQNAAFATYNVDGFAGSVSGKVSGGASKASSAVGKVSGAMGALGAVVPVLGAGIALWAGQTAKASNQTDEWAEALARGTMSATEFNKEYLKQYGGKKPDWLGHTAEWLGLASAEDEVREKSAALWRELTPLEQAQSKVAEWTQKTKDRFYEYGPAAEETRIAQERLAYWTGEAATKQEELDVATSGAVSTLGTLPAGARTAYESLDVYAQALGLDKDATEALRLKTEDLGTTLGDFVNPLGAYTGLLDEKKDADRKAAEATAAATESSKDSWEDYVTDVGVSFEEYMTRLEEQLAAQDNWEVNMLKLAGRVSQGTIDELARMGPEGAPLVAELVNRSDAELDKFDDVTHQRSKEATDAWGAQLTLAAPVLAAVGKKAGQGVVAELAAQLQAGTITVGQIASQYGIELAGGINPVLKSLGANTIRIDQARKGGNTSGYAEGGYTGDGGKYTPAGIVHAGEYVFTKEETAKAGVGTLEAYAASLRGYASGGFVTASDVPRPRSTAPYGQPISTAGDRTMQKGYDETLAWLKANVEATQGGIAGGGSVGGAWSSLWNLVKAQIPQARINSTFRPGDPGYHGRGKAVDFGFGSGPGGAGSAGLASINRLLHDQVGANLAELIYDGIGDDRPDLKNGRPLTYNAATRAQHANHVHAAVYHDGTDFVPQTGWAYLEKGEAVIPAEQNMRSREFSGATGGRSGGGSVTVAPPVVKVYLDGQEWRGIARVEAEGVVIEAENLRTQRGAYSG